MSARRGRALTVVLGGLLLGLDLATSALLWLMVITLLPDHVAWGAIGGILVVLMVLFAWPRPGRVERVLVLWLLPVGLLRGFAAGFRRWVARYPFLDAVWRVRFVVGIAAIVQNSIEGTLPIGIVSASIIAASYLLPWLRRVHTRRVQAAAAPSGQIPRDVVAAEATLLPSSVSATTVGSLR